MLHINSDFKMRNFFYAILATTMLASVPAMAETTVNLGDREFSSDRPGKATSPYTVPVGHFQVETDLLSYSQGFAGKSRTFQSFDPTVKFGVLDNVDLEVTFGGSINQVTRSNGKNIRQNGFGDIIVAAKVNFLGNDGGPLSLAVVPYVKFPTATDRLGNNRYEYGVSAPVTYLLPSEFALTVQPGLQVLPNENTRNRGRQVSLFGVVNVSHPITEKLSAFGELYGNTNSDVHTKAVYTADTGVAYMVAKNVQLDAGVNVGLNKAAPAMVVSTGLTIRF